MDIYIYSIIITELREKSSASAYFFTNSRNFYIWYNRNAGFYSRMPKMHTKCRNTALESCEFVYFS